MEKVCYRRPEYLYGKRCPTAPEQPSSFGPRYPQNPVKLGTIGEIPELVSGHTSGGGRIRETDQCAGYIHLATRPGRYAEKGMTSCAYCSIW